MFQKIPDPIFRGEQDYSTKATNRLFIDWGVNMMPHVPNALLQNAIHIELARSFFLINTPWKAPSKMY